MLTRRLVKPFAIVSILATLLLPAQSVGASSEDWTTGYVVDNQLSRYTNHREINYSPYEIAFKQYSGPQIFMRWWDCYGPYNVSYVWVEMTVGGWEWLTYEYPDETEFCIDVLGGGTGSFDGWVSWDGYA